MLVHAYAPAITTMFGRALCGFVPANTSVRAARKTLYIYWERQLSRLLCVLNVWRFEIVADDVGCAGE